MAVDLQRDANRKQVMARISNSPDGLEQSETSVTECVASAFKSIHSSTTISLETTTIIEFSLNGVKFCPRKRH